MFLWFLETVFDKRWYMINIYTNMNNSKTWLDWLADMMQAFSRIRITVFYCSSCTPEIENGGITSETSTIQSNLHGTITHKPDPATD